MSRKLSFIPPIPNYDWIRHQMNEDLKYRLETRQDTTSFGRPLYYRINVQLILTQECPYHCPFCIERQKPMSGLFDSEAQKTALRKILKEHPAARLTITGGEPGLYPNHVKDIVDLYRQNSQQTFVSINTAGYEPALNNLAHINLSINDYVKPTPSNFPGCTVQTVLPESEMHVQNLKTFMNQHPDVTAFSFRYLSSLEKHDYDISIFNELQNDPEIHIHTFRVGDFFTYVTFDYKDKHARITLGDMYQQTQNDYQDGYSNIIIHPNGHIGLNWT